ncbi:MAG: hypothetical protein WCR58_07785 [Bacteroidales bacterium]|jgi:hypothetical protein|nr:hypothetical protein [Bacteroidales bacterium]MCK9448185.1 hypothetical protein [Bacteroidales bacterium]MDD3700935.1 hypothetical protein [Bacteroidales bacterium]MDY0370009.1 hypothetical protein [Bacteroidales bacterium]
MKKIGCILLIATFFFTGNLFSQSANTKAPVTQDKTTDFQPGRYVDKDNDGVCDNWQQRPSQGRGLRFLERQNDTTRYYNPRTGRRPAFRNTYRGQGNRGLYRGRCWELWINDSLSQPPIQPNK